jgi:hypothetical protein
MNDLAIFAQSWLLTGANLGRADINDDNSVDFFDFSLLGSQWLSSNIITGVQLESFDNFVANGWSDGYDTGLMIQSVAPDIFHEGTGSLRVKFEARTATQWDVIPTKYFSPTINLSGKTLTFWLWTDLVNSSKLNQVIVWDSTGTLARFTVPKPSVVGWSQIIAPISAFVPGSNMPNYSNIGAMQLWFTTWNIPGNSVYIDDLRMISQ